MPDVIPIRERMIFEFRTPALYTAQWDGTKPAATLLLGELQRVVEEIGAYVVSAHYRAQLSRGAPDLDIVVARHEDSAEWALNVQRNHWIVLWRDMLRLVDAEVLPPHVGDARFRPVAPIIILSGRAPEIESD